MVRLGLVVSEFNSEITRLMEERAKEHAGFLGAEVVQTLRVPGAFDMPLAIKKLLESDKVDAVVTLGAVLEGQTQHDEVVAQHAARKAIDLSVEKGKPVSLGIIGPGASRAHAQARIDEYARRAVESAVKLCQRLQ
ncbi:6,7-dimethyl-8-ribityllumazine synthase [Candidatus Micrarchaeota archaeon]|nr:6,7-dimethyl-8-ribityllumazine synthase [Candidatus Micrarchaeota archaeon]